MAQALDLSGQPPGAAAIVARGFRIVIRYIGIGSEAKQISTAEWQDYLDHGVTVLLIAELGVNDAWEGLDDYALGAARAHLALADIDATAPSTVDRARVLVACAADAHATSAQVQDAVRYSQGFASVVGLWRSGFYGFVETSRAVHAAGAAGWHWRCGSEPTVEDKTWVNFWQRNTPPQVVVINGTACDINEIYALPMEDCMEFTPEAKAAYDQIYHAVIDGSGWQGSNLEKQLGFVLTELRRGQAELAAALSGGTLDAEALATRLEAAARQAATEGAEQAVTTTVLPALREVVREVLGEDNTAQADAIVDRLAERLRPAA